MDILSIFGDYGSLLQVFVPARALPFVPLILLVVWWAYQYTWVPKKLAPALAMALGLAVAFLFLDMPSWKEAIPTGLTLGGYAIAAWSGGKNLLELWKNGQDNPRPPTEITD